MKKSLLIMITALVIVFIGAGSFLWVKFLNNGGEKLQLVPQEKSLEVDFNSDSAVSWSTNPDYRLAISEAVASAKSKLNGKQPDFAYVVYISEENHDSIIEEVRNQIGPRVKIYGHTSNTIITNNGVIDNQTFAIGVLLVASEGITFGISSVDQNYYTDNSSEAGKIAITGAIKDAGKEPSLKPEMVFYMGTTLRGGESEILSGIASVIGKDVPVVGGNAKDFGPRLQNNWRQFTDKETYSSGLVLVAVYTDKKIGWGFESTFKSIDKKGIVTKAEEFRIVEIDNRPALEVYDEWLGGEFYKKLNAGEFNSKEEKVDLPLVQQFTLVNPIAKTVKGENNQMGQFAIAPIPDEQDVKNKSITTYAQVSVGDELSLYRGTWQIAMNRMETIPSEALSRANLKKGEGAFAIMAFCNGLQAIIPPEEFQKISAITNDILGTPFLGAITSGEQGPIPGIGNVNANIIESVVVIGK